MWWIIGTCANLVVAIAYLAIAGVIIVPLARERQVRSNRLGTATAAIFLTCAVHHGGHTVKALLPFLHSWQTLGLNVSTGLYTRLSWDPEAVVWDVLTAAVGLYYLSLRRTYAPLMRGARLFDDMRERQRQALEINDNIVQGLAAAQMALALGEQAQSEAAMTATLGAARGIITDLLGEVGTQSRLSPGDLRRATPTTLTAT
ncbi:MAG: hypothetical protein E6J03_03890 [Chloroflexi bacterium]|nr:MAG: hypothetical protein E6J03_03890 [Chloroflexota bacterium]